MIAVKFSLLRQKAMDVHPRPLAKPVFLLAGAAAVALIVFCLLVLDPQIKAASRGLPAWCTVAGHFFNGFGNGYNIFVPLGGALAVLAFATGRLPRRAHLAIAPLALRLVYLLAAIGIPSLVSVLAKWVFGRLRPKSSHLVSSLDFEFFTWAYNGIGLSFPSGHTTVAFASAYALGTLMPHARIALFLLAALVGAARIVLGAHYPSDVIAGALCGIVFASLVSRAFARQRLGLMVTADGAILPKPWPVRRHFTALAGALSGKLRGRSHAPAKMQTAGPA